jgi:hypothetical protein
MAETISDITNGKDVTSDRRYRRPGTCTRCLSTVNLSRGWVCSSKGNSHRGDSSVHLSCCGRRPMLIRGRYTGFLIAMDQSILHILIVDADDFYVMFDYLFY